MDAFFTILPKKGSQCPEVPGCRDIGTLPGHAEFLPCSIPHPYFPSIPTDVAIFALSIKLHNKLLSKITLERNLILDSTYSCNICMKQVSRDLATPSLTLPLCPGTGGCQGHCSSSRNSPTSARRQSRGAALGAPTAVGMWHELTQLCASQPGTHRGKSPTSCTGGMGTRPFITT